MFRPFTSSAERLARLFALVAAQVVLGEAVDARYTSTGTPRTRTTNFREALTSSGPRIVLLAAKVTF